MFCLCHQSLLWRGQRGHSFFLNLFIFLFGFALQYLLCTFFGQTALYPLTPTSSLLRPSTKCSVLQRWEVLFWSLYEFARLDWRYFSHTVILKGPKLWV